MRKTILTPSRLGLDRCGRSVQFAAAAPRHHGRRTARVVSPNSNHVPSDAYACLARLRHRRTGYPLFPGGFSVGLPDADRRIGFEIESRSRLAGRLLAFFCERAMSDSGWVPKRRYK